MVVLRFVAAISVASALIVPAAAFAQEYPTKPLRIITGGATGASGLSSRFISQGISGRLGQQVIVDSRGAGAIQGDIVAKSPADGYTLLVSGSSFWISPLMQKMPYDPVKDLAPISLVGRTPQILVVHPALPAKSIKELIALAKAKPGQLNTSIGGVGGTEHLGVELFKSMAGADILVVPYTADAQQLADLLSGQVQMTITTPASIATQIKLGKVRALGVTSPEPSELMPGLPPVASVLPGYEAVLRIAMLAPAQTPEPIIRRLNEEVVRYLKTGEARETFMKAGVEVIGSSPQELAATIKTEMTRWSKVIKDAGITVK